MRLAVSGEGSRLAQLAAAWAVRRGVVRPAAAVAAVETRMRDERSLAGPRRVRAALDAVAAARARVVVLGEAGYPAALAELWPEHGIPLWLLVRGELPIGPAVAVVGTRRPSLDGLVTARRVAGHLARNGITVVSGMARGIDQAAHRATLDAGGRTIGVLGTGFGVDYPSGGAELRQAVAASGALVTEHPVGTGVLPARFPARNRIISGLAQVVVVVEGRVRSGALMTARLAAEQGREVYAAPGSLNQPTAAGPLALIADGARPLVDLDDLVDAARTAWSDRGPARTGARPDPPLIDDCTVARDVAEGTDEPAADRALSPAARVVWTLLGATAASPDALARSSGLPAHRVLAACAELVTCGVARATANGFVAVVPAG